MKAECKRTTGVRRAALPPTAIWKVPPLQVPKERKKGTTCRGKYQRWTETMTLGKSNPSEGTYFDQPTRKSLGEPGPRRLESGAEAEGPCLKGTAGVLLKLGEGLPLGTVEADLVVLGRTVREVASESRWREGVGAGPWGEVSGTKGEPSLSTIMAAIQDIRGSISPWQPKLDVVEINVNLLRTEMGKISEKVAMAEAHIVGLMATTKLLEEQVRSLTKKSSEMEAELEEQEGRSRRNNVRVEWVSEGMQGHSMDLFVEDLVLNKLKLKRLSNLFSEERKHRVPGSLPK
ncbi:hypothetical protein NDU88_003893 [Pleurodeles waltl]|uniref:Uncharacterized protein n=1 Tax=Pleurodeles waltl TaxID=8319 RepID=A0AAV7KXS8_PLEWA|nr:hypothetical protein NDU88_003893 [Pleurodeles waltl]